MKLYVVNKSGENKVVKASKPMADWASHIVCELPDELDGKAFKVIEETNELGETVKRAVLDEVAEQARLEALAAQEAAEEAAKLERETRRTEIADLKSNIATLTLPQVKDLLVKVLDELNL